MPKVPDAEFENVQQATMEYGQRLMESNRWAPYFEGELADIKDPWIRSATAIMLENAHKDQISRNGFSYADPKLEDVRIANVGNFDKFSFPIIRALFPQLAATELVSIQPMMGPTTLVFFLDYLYASNKAGSTSGTRLYENFNRNYSGEQVEGEIAYSQAASTTVFSGYVVAWLPIRPGTFSVSSTLAAVTTVATDDGNGTITGTNVASATINYTTGAFAITFSTAPDNPSNVTIAYEYDSEMNSNIPQVDLVLSSSPVKANPRKLRTRFGMEAEQDLRNVHGLEAEVELTAAITSELKFEVDLEVVNNLRANAYAAGPTEVVVWSKNPPTGVPYVLHKNTLKDVFIQASSLIFRRSGRATGTWIVAGDMVCDVIESMDGFVSANPAVVRGIHKIGRLAGRWDVYKDPSAALNEWMVGYKGPSFLETGYVYCPYIPVYATPLVQLDDFISRKGIGTRYGSKLVNSKFYVKGTISGTP